MKRIFVVVDADGVMHQVSADSMVSDGPRVVLWDADGKECGSFLGAVSAVMEVPAVPCARMACSVELTPGEAVAFDPPPRITIGTLNITGFTPKLEASIAAQIQSFMDRRQSSDQA